jgi:hypothetical protein
MSEIDMRSTSAAAFMTMQGMRERISNVVEAEGLTSLEAAFVMALELQSIEEFRGIIAMTPEEIALLDPAKEFQVKAIQELYENMTPLFTRDTQGDPQLSDKYLRYISAVETFKTRPGLYPEKPDDMGFESNTYDGRDDPDEKPFIKMWVVPNALVRWPATTNRDGKIITTNIFTMNDLWRMHREEELASPRTLLAAVKDHIRCQKDWLNFQVIQRTSDQWLITEKKKAWDLAMGYDSARKRIISIRETCAICKNDGSTCRNHVGAVRTFQGQMDRWIRMAEKYLGKNGAVFAEMEGKSRYSRVLTQVRRKAKNRKKTPIGVCWLEPWVAGDYLPDLNKRIDGSWAIQAFFDAEARGLIELNSKGEYEEV